MAAGICGAQQHVLALGPKYLRQLADGGGLAGTVYADH